MLEVLRHDLAERPRPHVKAWYANYLLYGEELGVKDFSDPKRGFALAQESRAEKSLFGLELVGRAYGDGRGPGYRDTSEAVKYLEEAAAKGRDSAMCELSKFYFLGRGVKKDQTKAEELAFRAGWQSATDGLMHLAVWWEDPRYVGTPDHAKALALYYAAAELGVGEARQKLRQLATAGDSLAEKYTKLDFVVGAREGATAYPVQVKAAVRWLDEHASADDIPVQIALAELMMERLGPVYDAKAARTKLTRSAAAGSDEAQNQLAWMAWRGIGQKSDPAAAVATWRVLSEKHNAGALNAIGWLSWWGNGEKYGVQKDARTAFASCRQAADLGDWMAQRNVADCYAHGIGTEVNYYLAAKYYQMIEQRGFVRGRDMKQRMLAAVKD